MSDHDDTRKVRKSAPLPEPELSAAGALLEYQDAEIEHLRTCLEAERVAHEETRTTLEAVREELRQSDERVAELEEQLQSAHEHATELESEVDLRGVLLDRVQHAVGEGWWHGAAEKVESLQARLEAVERERDEAQKRYAEAYEAAHNRNVSLGKLEARHKKLQEAAEKAAVYMEATGDNLAMHHVEAIRRALAEDKESGQG